MHATHPDLLGDLGDQIPATDLSFGIRRPVHDRPGRWERKETAAADYSEFEDVCPVDLIDELMSEVAPLKTAPRAGCAVVIS